MQKKICLAGDGWGTNAAILGLVDKFSEITLVTSDPETRKLGVEKEVNVAESLPLDGYDLYIFAGKE